MTKIAIYLMLFTTYTLSIATSSVDSLDFRHQFGPDSAAYNAPLYFGSHEQASPQDNRPKQSVREQIRARMNKSKELKKLNH